MKILEAAMSTISVLFFLCYFYQYIYILISLFKKPKISPPGKANRFAVLICARNEASVIGALIRSIQNQTYDKNLVEIFVMADNCTDDTAEVARRSGATVYTRFDKTLVGKGYALNTLLQNIARDRPQGFDGYFIMDADNLMSPTYIEKMNAVFSDGYDIVTSYRNSKNFGDNWISSGYALWFLREARYLNRPRMTSGTSCAVSGTGFLFSRKVLEEQGFWPFHLLTEDIEFTIHHIVNGYKVGFADAIFYDEQPTTFVQSWHQRLRWACGFVQVFKKYGGDLLRGICKGSFSCFDMFMNYMAAMVLSLVSLFLSIVMILVGLCSGQTAIAVATILHTLWGLYATVFLLGLITTITEWKRIIVPARKKILYLFTFPIFMATYIPIAIVSLFRKETAWVPILHHNKATSVPNQDQFRIS